MSERKKKSRRGVADNVSLVPERLSRSSSDNFANLFLALCEEYDVFPTPKILNLNRSLGEVRSLTARQRSDHKKLIPTGVESPGLENVVPASIIYATYESTKELDNIEKIECTGHEVSVCMLDALSMSIEKFDSVTTIRLRNCRINAYGISQIAEMITLIGCVRDLNLDMNPNIRENYHLLCTPAGKLRYLSLKCCNISDAGVDKIANELKYRENETPRLVALNLANNRITDLGAKHIAEMLRTNSDSARNFLDAFPFVRSLQSLVLAGNGISDAGAIAIIRELCIYPLSHEEIMNLRRLNFARLSTELGGKSNDSIPSDTRNSSSSIRNHSSKKSSKTQRIKRSANKKRLINDRGESSFIVINQNDAGLHPFVTEARRIGGQVMIPGNFELQHFNLSYNRLTDETLREMSKCLFYQNYEMLDDRSGGLIHVELEGNDFQTEGNESWYQLCELLRKRASSRKEQTKTGLSEARAN